MLPQRLFDCGPSSVFVVGSSTPKLSVSNVLNAQFLCSSGRGKKLHSWQVANTAKTCICLQGVLILVPGFANTTCSWKLNKMHLIGVGSAFHLKFTFHEIHWWYIPILVFTSPEENFRQIVAAVHGDKTELSRRSVWEVLVFKVLSK